MSLHRVCCCPTCCATTSFSLTSMPSVTYTLACGTNKEYTNGGGATFNLNSPTPNALLQSVNPVFPGACSTECIYATTSNVASGAFYNRCPGATFGNTWTYSAGARCEIFRTSTGNYTAVLRMFHLWNTSTTGPSAMPTFTVGITMALDITTDLCPDGTYVLGQTFTDCNGVFRTHGTFTTIGTGGPSVTFGTPSGVAVLA